MKMKYKELEEKSILGDQYRERMYMMKEDYMALELKKKDMKDMMKTL
jgi:hypothetical protein